MKNRVLVVCPTNSVKAYCLGKFITNLKKLDLTNADVLFSDDTIGNDEHMEILQKLGYEVVKVKKTVDAISRGERVPIVQCLANARNHLRSEFNKRTKYTHCLWIDSDILPPVDAIPRLLSHNKDLVSAVYWQKRIKMVDGKTHEYLSPMLFKYQEAENVPLGIHEYGSELLVEDLFPNRLIGGIDTPLVAFGTGCFLVSRALMEDNRWTFRFNPDKPDTTEDMWFSMDLIKLGYIIHADTSVCCRHLMQQWNGKVRSQERPNLS